MVKNLLTTIFLLSFISVGYFATDIYLPSLPKIMDYFHATESETQMTVFTYLISFALTPIFVGPISDHIGRKKVILFGLMIALIATIGCYFAQTIREMILWRFVQGMGTGAILISSRAMVADLYQGIELAKKISYITMAMPLILAIAPAFGGFLQDKYGWHYVFLFLICYFVLMILAMIASKDSLKSSSTKKISQVFASYVEVLKNRSFLLAGLGMILPTMGMFAYLTASPFLFQEVIGLTPAQYGLLALFIGATIMLMSGINAKLLQILPIDRLIGVGAGCMFLAGTLLLFLHALGILKTWSLLVPTLIYFCCMPFTIANSASKSMTFIKKNFGAANGLLTTAQFLAGALGSLVFSLIPENDALPLAVCYLSLGVLAFVIHQLSKKTVQTNH